MDIMGILNRHFGRKHSGSYAYVADKVVPIKGVTNLFDACLPSGSGPSCVIDAKRCFVIDAGQDDAGSDVIRVTVKWMPTDSKVREGWFRSENGKRFYYPAKSSDYAKSASFVDIFDACAFVRESWDADTDKAGLDVALADAVSLYDGSWKRLFV